MQRHTSRMTYFEVIIFLCSMVTFMPSYCETESENSNRKASLPKFLSDADLSNIEPSVENEESLRKIVKRLAPEKNGEYQIYQVFFGNVDLLKEWLKGAGVTGQPGVDFPALTTIPVTSFSCRGLKGGYYADLETNCQVFHICDNGRKISFLCPNGTIFQQSQLICDWWFKVDCSKSTELYEQSSEQLLEEERRRAEARKSKLDYQRSIENGGQQDYYDVQNLSYDGRQNGRVKSYEETPKENQLQSNREKIKTSRHFDSANFNQESTAPRDGNQLANGFQSNQNSNSKFNQFARNTEEGDVNRYPTTNQDYYNTPKKAQNYHATNRNSNNQRDEKGALKRLKFKTSTKSNTASTVPQRVTPAYTESTTFRASNTSPIKESQQVAESAAFVSNRGNRFNENSGNSHQYYYQLYLNRDPSSKSSNYETTTWRRDNDNDVSTQRNDFLSFTGTTSVPYETTTQYVTTTITPSCNDDPIAETTLPTSPSTFPDTPPTTESLQFADSNYDYRGNQKNTANVRSSFVSYYDNNNRNSNGNTETIPPTTRSYITTDSYRQNTDNPNTSHQRFTIHFAPTASVRVNNFGRNTEVPLSDSKSFSKSPSTVSSGYRQNFISSTTEKPSRTTTASQRNVVTERDLSPYDRSFTYKQGKVMSTLGPYVPFTKSYVHTTTNSTTAKPTLYTPTVPTYTPAYTSAKTLIPKLKQPTSTTLSKAKSNTAKLSEREHALSMLHSLKDLENKVPSLSERTSNVSAPAPSTLHSLALYFSTATENFDSNETTDHPSISIETEEDIEQSIISKKSNGTVQVPTGLLTPHTVNSYAELFKLNNSFDSNNLTTDDNLDNTSLYADDYNEDLELQQSGSSLDDLRKSNSTRLRELAQVFTHALSAYLLDPDSFKKVLTEIRPTEPPRTTTESDQWKTTVAYSVTNEDYTPSIKEKDEVLDFSEDSNDIRQKLSTIYPTTTEPPSTTVQDNIYDISTLPSTYYTTPRSSIQDVYEASTNFVSTNPSTNAYFDTSVPPTESTFTAEHPSTSYTTDSSGFYNQNVEIDKGNVGTPVTSNYVPTDDSGNQSRVGGFQNNSATVITEPYGNKPFVTTPINDNYVVSPTPSPPSVYVHMVTHNWERKSTSKKPEQQLTPPLFETHAETVRRDSERSSVSSSTENYSSTPMSVNTVRATTVGTVRGHEIPIDRKISNHKPLLHETKPTSRSYAKFGNFYNLLDDQRDSTERPVTTTSRTTDFITTTNNPETTPCANSDSTDPVNRNEELKALDNDHWTSSPAVTRLWETSVFVDPQRINYGLESDLSTTISADSSTESQEKLETPTFQEDASESSEEFVLDEDQPFAQRLSRDKDSPTTFSLFPTSFTAENTVTPKPLITTRSSITTTITSSITSTNSLPEESLTTSLLPYDKSNGTENDVAEQLFGKLNVSSTDTLMRVMKQADNNETVRQLVLLLIQHCTDPANNTMLQKKEELLNTLLKLPVNEFSSTESKNAVSEINRLNLSQVRSTSQAASVAVVTEPAVTTFRSKKNRKFRTTTEHSINLVRRSEKGTASEGINSLREDETSASDNRALELLRSLYTIATKWG